MKMGVSDAGVSYGCRNTVGWRSVRRASREMIHVRLDAWVIIRVTRIMFFIFRCWGVVGDVRSGRGGGF